MPAAPLPPNEKERLERLRAYGILDTAPEESFQRIVRVASTVLDVPIALISLVDEGRQWFKAKVGLDAPETPRDLAFCAHAILGTDVFVVTDATKNPLFKDNPLVTGAPDIRFYAGAPLKTYDGYMLGTVCAIDQRPREPSPAQIALLRDLSAVVVEQMELRAAGRTALEEVAERTRIDAFKSSFIATVNHELRTPLTSIIGVIDLINSGAAGDVPPEITELMTIADRNAAVLLRLINDLLDSAKLAEGKLALSVDAVNLDAIVRESVANMRSYCREHDVQITLVETQRAMVMADKVRIAQVMNNLISNGVKFSPRGASVDVGLTIKNGYAEVSIEDKAGGIPASIRPHIFEKFIQARTPDTLLRPGTGLGLNIAKAIIEQHRGDIGFDTTDGVGTRFYFRLPLVSIVAGP